MYEVRNDMLLQIIGRGRPVVPHRDAGLGYM
jgi:hypothetical protein